MTKIKLSIIDVSVELEGEESTENITSTALGILQVMFQDRLKAYEYEPQETEEPEPAPPESTPPEHHVVRLTAGMYQ